MMMIIMVGLILMFILYIAIANNNICRKEGYLYSESEVNSFFEDDIGGMDIAFSGILGKILCV